MVEKTQKPNRFTKRMYEIIFEADTAAGRAFNIVLVILILLSVSVIILESVESYRVVYSSYFSMLEWTLTIIFTIEYLARIWCVPNKRKYIFSFLGIIDLLSILPTYLGLVLSGAHSFMVIRSIRLLRIFRILKLSQFVGEGENIVKALRASRHKITVFLFTVVTSVVIMGTINVFS
jgi:voltage-gated potassium channel